MQVHRSTGLWIARAALAVLVLGNLSSFTSAQLIVSDTSVGYIDSAVPFSHVRFRFDAAYGADSPDRAEFFYGTWAAATPGAPGPRLRESNVDYQDLTAYLEYAPLDSFSIFADFPTRFLNPDFNENTAGFADMSGGIKWAVAQTDCSLMTLQLKTWIPTGDADRGLGTNHVSVEPGVLLLGLLTERLTFEGELKDWIPIDGTEGFAGNVLRYGAGLCYLAHQSCYCDARPVVEVVGWSVLDGQKTNRGGVFDAEGDTIVNLKAGIRFYFGDATAFEAPGSSLYVGYGRALTGDVWYSDIARVELRVVF
jgi:hypothetical protein